MEVKVGEHSRTYASMLQSISILVCFEYAYAYMTDKAASSHHQQFPGMVRFIDPKSVPGFIHPCQWIQTSKVSFDW